MGISAFPSGLQAIIQQGFLEREFQEGLRSRLGFRAIADREAFPAAIGETITKTRKGLKAPVTTPLNPAGNTNLDNGLSPSGWTVEQYSLGVNMYGDTIDLNMVTSRVGISGQFLKNANTNGIQAMQSLDRLARDTLFGGYLGGNTRVTVTLGSPDVSVAVDDIRGFRNVLVNGVLVPVSGAHVLTAVIGSSTYSVSGAAADVINVSTAPGGVSGVLTLTSNVSVSDATAGHAVVAATAPSVKRPLGRATTADIVASDTLTMGDVLAAVADLRSNNVPPVSESGLYHCQIDDRQLLGLFKDDDFKMLYRGAYASETYKNGQIIDLMGVRFIPTNEAPQQSLNGVVVHRAIVCGQGAIIEGDLTEVGYSDIGLPDALKVMVDDVCMVTREPIDRLQQIVAQSWYWIGGFALPTDATANTLIIPTATNSYYKRAVVIESA